MSMDLMTLPIWFLVFLVFILGAYFAWSFPRVVNGLKESLTHAQESFEKMAEKLFEKTDNHENRLSRLEGEHEGMKNNHPGGERFYDPKERKYNSEHPEPHDCPDKR